MNKIGNGKNFSSFTELSLGNFIVKISNNIILFEQNYHFDKPAPGSAILGLILKKGTDLRI